MFSKKQLGLYVSIGGLHFFCKKFGGIEFYAYLCKINQKERYVWANKKRTKDEIIAALKATLARKKEWEKQAQEDFKSKIKCHSQRVWWNGIDVAEINVRKLPIMSMVVWNKNITFYYGILE